MVGPLVPFLRVHDTWYPWYQISSRPKPDHSDLVGAITLQEKGIRYSAFLCSSARPRNISTQFVNSACFFILPRSPRSSAPHCLLPTHRLPRLPLSTHRPPRLCPGRPRSTLPQPGPAFPQPHAGCPAPPRRARQPPTPPASVVPRPTMRVGPVSPRPAARVDRPARPRPARPHAPVIGPAPQRLPAARPDPTLPRPCPVQQRTLTAQLGPALPCPAHRVGGLSPPAPAPLVRAELLFVLNFFLIKINEFMCHAKNTMDR
jgi:hypothetical protein